MELGVHCSGILCGCVWILQISLGVFFFSAGVLDLAFVPLFHTPKLETLLDGSSQQTSSGANTYTEVHGDPFNPNP